MEIVDLVVLITATVGLLSSVTICVRVIVYFRDDPLAGYGFASAFGIGLLALIAIAWDLGRLHESWTIVPIVAINAVMQPFCLYVFVGSAYNLMMALFGRVTYAWQTMPRDACDETRYRVMRVYCAIRGVIGCFVAAALSEFFLFRIFEEP